MAIKVNPGRIVQTRTMKADCDNILGLNERVEHYLQRHLTGDWGDLDPDDSAANDHAAICGHRVLSSYNLPPGLSNTTGHSKVWIITEADRTATTILWPSDY